MNDDNIVPKRLYNIKLLNEDLQKQNNDFFTAQDVKVSPAGVLEADRVWQDVPFVTKVFYNGEFYITELGPDEVEEWYNPDEEHHHHDDEDE